LGRLARPELSEAEMMAALRLNVAVKKALDQDGLLEWAQPQASNTVIPE
jgi:hypothetical protein